MKILYSILSIIAFYLFYWIGKSILYSFVDGTWTLEEIVKYEWYVAGGVAGLICLVLCMILDVPSDNYLMVCGFIIIASTIGASNLPHSVGLAVLYNIIVICCQQAIVWNSSID